MIEVKTILAHVLRNFEIECSQKFEDLHYECEIVARPAVPVYFKLKQRFADLKGKNS
jgi:hypothetical protein